MTLKERVASLRATGGTTGGQIDFDCAQRRMHQWRSQEELTEHELLQVVGEPVESVSQRLSTPPVWLSELYAAFSDVTSSKPQPHFPSTADGSAAFLHGIERLINHGRDRLNAGVKALMQSQSDLPFDSETIEDLLYANLSARLLPILSRTFVLELNVARLQNLLEGETAAQRFHSFIERIRQPAALLAVLEEYPVLARQLMSCIDQWVTFALTFLDHLLKDWTLLRHSFVLETDPGVLVEVTGNAGDRHRGGRSVLLLRFSSGFRLVYKPRSLAVDLHFQELLNWLNCRQNYPSFRTLTVLDRGDHGWVEFVSATSCTTADQVERFYERIGGHLAVLHALNATDLHGENIVAAGEYPM